MYLFWRLLLSHLLADFPFQTDAVYRLKARSGWGVVLHGTIAGVTGFALCGPYLSHPLTWALCSSLWIFHIILDAAKLRLSTRLHRWNASLFVLDQVLHVGSLALAAWLGAGLPKEGVDIWLYGSDRFVQHACAYLAATYGTLFLVMSVEIPTGRQVSLPSRGRRWIGYAERAAVLTLVRLGGTFILLLIGYVILRITIGLRGRWPDPTPWWGQIFGLVVAISLGMALSFL